MEDDFEEVTLIDEEGVERKFKLHDAFDVDDTAYYLVEAVDDPDAVLLLKETADGLETVDEEEFDRVMSDLERDE